MREHTLKMEYDPELETAFTYAMLQVERDLSLLTNSLVNATPLTEIKEEVKGRKLKVRLDPHFLFSSQCLEETSSTLEGTDSSQAACETKDDLPATEHH